MFMTDASQKVKDTNGVHIRGMGSVGCPRVSMVMPLGGAPPKVVFEVGMLQRETPYFYPVSMKLTPSPH